jgi:transcriptional regulator with XRE-family HTH domain
MPATNPGLVTGVAQLSQRDLAELASVSQTLLSQYERRPTAA